MNIIIKAHKNDFQARQFAPQIWNETLQPDRPWFTCSYCGSMHPKYFLEAMKHPEVQFSGSDWKYGWPHKFYIHVPNPQPDFQFEIGSANHPVAGYTQVGTRWVQYGTRKYLYGKWYNNHLIDEGVPPEVFDVIREKFKIQFTIVDGNRLHYAAPYRGFQVSSHG